MKLNINLEGLAVPVSQPLVDVLNRYLADMDEPEHPLLGVFINFKDTDYSASLGGYHPVEVGLEYQNGQWKIEYITDFAYVGGAYPELAKEVDFSFSENALYLMFGGPLPLNHPDTKEFYQTWESNFISYVEMGCYDKIVVTPID